MKENTKSENVEWKALGEIGKIYGGISGKKKEDFKNGNKKLIMYKNVYENLSLNFNVEDKVRIEENEKQRKLKYGDIIFTSSSENLKECGLSSVVTETPNEELYLNSFCFFLRLNNDNLLLPNFSKHLFRSEILRKKIIKTASGVTRFNVSKELMKKIQIPLPPLKKQAKIAAVLDKFTELTEELTAREAQYEYYRDMLLSEDYLNKILSKKNLIKKQLNEIAKLKRGKRLVKKELEKEGKYPVFQNSLTPLGYYNRKNNDGGKTCIISAGSAGEIFYQKKDFWAADDVFVIVSDSVLNKYLYYYLINKQNLIKTNIRKGTISRLPKEVLENLEILIPPIEIQNEIVNILDNFETLVNDIRQGLPREIELRQKQYEYYREKLLTFE